MAALWLPSDDRHALALREPNLLVPGKKPVGRVLGKKNTVIACLMRSALNSANGPFGVASNATFTSDYATLTGTSSSSVYFPDAANADYSLGCTLYVDFIPLDTTSVRIVSFGSDSETTSRIELLIDNFGKLGMVIRDAGGNVVTWLTDLTMTVGVRYCLAASADTNVRNIVVIGDDNTYETLSSTGSSFRKNFRSSVNGVVFGAYLSPSIQPMQSRFFFGAVENRYRTRDDLARILRDPYNSLLRPANDTPYIISVPTGGGTTINADFISSATSVYEPTLTTGAVTISADFVSAATSVYEPTVTAPSGAQDITADFISSATSVHEPTLTAGAVTISADFVSASTSVYEPTVFSGSAIVSDFIAATTAVHEPTITTGAVTIAADLIAAGTIVYEPTVSSAVNISADFIASATSVYEPTVGIGAVTIQPDFISSGTIVYEPSIPFGQIISADFIAALSAVYEPSVTDVSTIWTEITPVSTIWTEI